jgi:hypothetical protein
MFAAKKVAPLTRDEQIATEQRVVDRWNALAERCGFPLRVEIWRTNEVGSGGLRFGRSK